MATDAARALVESLINGELTEATRTEVVRLRFARSYLPLRHTPVTAVTSVTEGDDSVDSGDYRVTPHGLFRTDGEDWAADTETTVVYTTGWPVDSEPSEVQAALARADEIDVGATSEKVGDVSLQRSASATLEGIRALVKRWVRP